MSAFADYLDLRIAVCEHVGNSDIADLMPRFVLMAEARLNDILRHGSQITYDTLTFSNGEAALPDDFLEMISVFYDSYGTQMRACSIAETKNSNSPYSRYAIDGSNILIYQYGGDKDIVYYAKLPTLTESVSSTNWLLESCPAVYLYAVSLEASKYLKNVDLTTATELLLENSLRDIRRSDNSARWGNSTVRVQGNTP